MKETLRGLNARLLPGRILLAPRLRANAAMDSLIAPMSIDRKTCFARLERR